MQQLQQPQFKAQLKPPPALPLWERAPDLQAIVTLLNQKFNSRGIQVQGDRRDQRVGILLEADVLPSQPTLLEWVHRELTAIDLPSNQNLSQLEVYARITGQRYTEWQAILELKRQPDTKIPLEAGVHSDLKSDLESDLKIDSAQSESEVVLLSQWLQQGSIAAEQIEFQSESQPDRLLGEPTALTQFLRFYFTPQETALLPLQGIKEILKISSAAILPVPQMPTAVLGLYNCRGEILWLVELGMQVGLEHPLQVRTGSDWLIRRQIASAESGLTAIVIEVEQQTLGLVVPEVLDIESHPVQQIQPAPASLFLPQMLPFIQGYLTSSNSPILNPNALLRDSRLQIHR